jgi:hypothetical protein
MLSKRMNNSYASYFTVIAFSLDAISADTVHGDLISFEILL